jgi:hypothetical protein
MYKHIKLTTNFLLLCFAFLLLFSCNNAKEEKPDEKAPPAAALLTPGRLDTLYIERQTFDNLQMGTKLFFSYTFKAADSLTLHGWVLKQGNKFDSLPNIKLKNTNASPLTYGVGTYFGNIIVTSTEFNKIKTALIPAMNYVLFAPVLQGNNISYRIFVSDKLFTPKAQILVIAATGAVANPSPPKSD